MASSSVSVPYRPVLDSIHGMARRRAMVLVFQELPLALSLIFGAGIVFLVIGTDALSAMLWIPVGGAAVLLVAARIRKQWLARYELAQMVDARLGLDDSLSTAWFLLNSAEAKNAVVEYQLANAARLAATVQPARVFPLRFDRSWTVPCVLFMVAACLAVLRYSRTGTLDFRANMIPAPVAVWLEKTVQAWEQSVRPERGNPRGAEAASKHPTGNAALGERGRSGEEVSTADGRGSLAGEGSAQTPDAAEAQKALEQLQRQFSADQGDGRSPSLLSRMQDALGGMIAQAQEKLRAKDSSNTAPSSQQDPNANPQENTAQMGKDSSRQPGQNGHSQASSSSLPHAIEKGSSATLGAESQPVMDSGNNSQSGAGRNDGDKEIRSAEELKAIGKLQEIIGKRSATLTGEMTIAKPSRNQQLSTAYSNSTATHMDRGDEIESDEVPPEYRAFVRAYMEAVHRQAAANSRKQ